MKQIRARLAKSLPVVFILLAVISVGYWLFTDPTRDFVVSNPGKDSVNVNAAVSENIEIGAFFERKATETSSLSDTWTRFRGERSDNIKQASVPLINGFGGKLPPVQWSIDLGEGHSGAAIYKGEVFVLDYDETLKADVLLCYGLVSGKELWKRWYKIQVKRNHGMSRTVPAVTEKYILTMGPRGQVMCLDRLTGDLRWSMDVVKQYESEIPLWYTGQCPLIVNDVAILAPGGNALLIGVDCATGSVLWETPNPDAWKMAHSSVMPYTFNGRNMFVYSAVGGVVGVAADGVDVGKVLWKSSEWNKSVVAPSPVCMPDGKIFLTAGYGAGSMLMQLTANKDGFSVKTIKTIKPGDGLSSEQQTPILMDGLLFGVMPKDAKTMRNQLVCVEASDPTKVVWTSSSEARFGLGPYMMADGKLFLLNDDATLYIFKKQAAEFKQLDKIQLFEGQDAWAPLAVADGYMVLRDSKKMICIDLNQR